MRIGIPKEIKPHEYRVPLLPEHLEKLRSEDHFVMVECGAYEASGCSDDYLNSIGVNITDQMEIYATSNLVVKVKEPTKSELKLGDGPIFSFMHYASSPYLASSIRKLIAFEEVQTRDGQLPILKPMSQIAGRMAVLEGVGWLVDTKGILVTGMPSVAPADAFIIGAGVVGQSAARVAAGLGMNVVIADIDTEKLSLIESTFPANVTPVYSSKRNIEYYVRRCDLLVGAVLSPGEAAPKIIKEDHINQMRHGAVFVDVSIDQGGCSETSRPTTHDDPIYWHGNAAHYCVTNIPGVVPYTSSRALAYEVYPWVRELVSGNPIPMIGKSSAAI